MKRITKWLCAFLAAMMAFLLLPAAAENGGGVPEALTGIVLLKEGDSGDAVAALQQRLKALDYRETETDGVYGPGTAEAVMKFQKASGLMRTGMADRLTIENLFREDAEANPEFRPRESRSSEYELYEDSAWGYAPTAFYTASPAMAAETGYFDTNEYSAFADNRFRSVKAAPLSTFAAEVDTASYAQFRRLVLEGSVPPPDAVRVEEMLNYFSYDYASPSAGEPFGVTMETGPCPWNKETRLLLIGLKAAEVQVPEGRGQNLVFLIDTSGSMEGADRLDLVKRAFLLLLDTLGPEDTVSIVTYASGDRVVLEGVSGGEKTRIMEAISDLYAYGSTNGGAGITRAYEIAEKHLIPGGVNRIILATDGDLNVGVTSEGELARLVMDKKLSGVTLTVMGFGYGNYKDNKMEALALYGDGTYWYIDTVHEARRALVTEAGGRFVTVAKDVKLQVDFNPAYVKGYRLIGYEDRLLAPEDFADDSVDGGEVGSGHRVTALYEIVPAGSDFDVGSSESRYTEDLPGNENGEWLTVSIRCKAPDREESGLYAYPLTAEAAALPPTDNLRFAAAVAETAMVLRDSPYRGSASYAGAAELLRECGNVLGDSYKEEFLYLVSLLERGN
ncbi:MAG: von Willebrand factor type A domain-containing protein [Clostridia bacterium]|nr:von Willebrand factor type A domain-containing protein [Clostridia bacterium]